MMDSSAWHACAWHASSWHDGACACQRPAPAPHRSAAAPCCMGIHAAPGSTGHLQPLWRLAARRLGLAAAHKLRSISTHAPRHALPPLQAPGYVANTAQRRLAEEVTRFVHGEAGLQQAIKATEALAPGAGAGRRAAGRTAAAQPPVLPPLGCRCCSGGFQLLSCAASRLQLQPICLARPWRSHQARCRLTRGDCRRRTICHPAARPAGAFLLGPAGGRFPRAAALCVLLTLLPPLCRPCYCSLQVGAALADVMVAVGMQPSKGAVRRMIKASQAASSPRLRRRQRMHRHTSHAGAQPSWSNRAPCLPPGLLRQPRPPAPARANEPPPPACPRAAACG